MIFEGGVNLGHRFPSKRLTDPVEREYTKQVIRFMRDLPTGRAVTMRASLVVSI